MGQLTQDDVDKAIADSEARMKEFATDTANEVASKYAQVDSAYHTFVKAHPQAAMNIMWFVAVPVATAVGWLVGHFAK